MTSRVSWLTVQSAPPVDPCRDSEAVSKEWTKHVQTAQRVELRHLMQDLKDAKSPKYGKTWKNASMKV